MAVAGGVVSSIAGVEILHVCVNDVVAALGAANIVLYAGIYTTLKRRSTINTWVGAVVGALPPMMGWAACSGGLDAGAWVMGWLLYAWQFPHFNALSWSIRGDYARAGYRMAVVEDPKWNARVSLRYSLGLVPVSVVAPLLDMTDWWFMLDSGLVNVLLCERAWRFYKERNDETAKKLFFASLVYLPVVLALMLLHKKKEEKEQV
jgi:protoheme IX farnesyltransferase